MLVKLAGEVAVHVRRIGVHPLERLVHDLHFRFEELVLLVRFPRVLAVALQALHFLVQLPLVRLRVADVFDCCV